jgi:hypothetical protein
MMGANLILLNDVDEEMICEMELSMHSCCGCRWKRLLARDQQALTTGIGLRREKQCRRLVKRSSNGKCSYRSLMSLIEVSIEKPTRCVWDLKHNHVHIIERLLSLLKFS